MKFIKTTIIGGVVFIVPVVIVVAIVGKAYSLMMMVAKPLDAYIPTNSIGGVAVVNILALLAIVAICFIAGMIARSALADKAYKALDNILLTLPGYAFIKGFTDSMDSSEDAAKSFLPVLVKSDDYSQIGFEVERLSNGTVVIYLPGAPNPWSGSVVYFSEDRVGKLDLSVTQAINNIKQLGRGSSKLVEKF